MKCTLQCMYSEKFPAHRLPHSKLAEIPWWTSQADLSCERRSYAFSLCSWSPPGLVPAAVLARLLFKKVVCHCLLPSAERE